MCESVQNRRTLARKVTLVSGTTDVWMKILDQLPAGSFSNTKDQVGGFAIRIIFIESSAYTLSTALVACAVKLK
jgi:hypothetical protein